MPRGRQPKPDALRQRRNKVASAAHLPTAEAAAANAVPPLPDRARDEHGKPVHWHPMVLGWWKSVWRSPMASEYLDADMRGGLYLLADLHQLRWTLRDTSALKEIAAEIRLQEVRFGLSPIDRSRLRWTIDAGETAAERTEARRERKVPKPSKDPRAVLKAI
jgi:hypothetical protein